MKILVLGGTGAMGASLVPLLAANGNEVIVTSRSKHHSGNDRVCYWQGDAHELPLLRAILRSRYDAIVDFMVYTTAEFQERRDLLLNATNQYIFLSSSRVYANSETPLTEDSPRLLDVAVDAKYLETDEYALTKARQENLLRESGKQNWTIVRPYITYSNERLQLGVFEKELWLYRALHGQTIVVPKDIMSHTTTLTWGGDVAKGIAALVGNPQAYGQELHITTNESIRWSEVLELYKRVFYEATGHAMKVQLIDSSEEIGKSIWNQYQIRYDRLFDRRFDNSRFRHVTEECEFISPQEGLESCLRVFLEKPKFHNITIKAQAWMDRKTRERTSLSCFGGYKNKMKYMIGRYTPYFKMKMKER